jgi:MFS family permease
MLALVQGASLAPGWLAACVVVGAAAMAALAWHERRIAEPMLPFRLWRHRMVALSGLGSFTIGALMMGVVGFLPTYVQSAMGRSALDGGLVLAAMTVTWTAASFAAGQLMIRASYRATAIVGGIALLGGSLVLLAMTPHSGVLWAGAGALLIGVGMGSCNTTYLVSVQAAVDWQDRGAATSSNMFMRIVGQSVGAALFGAMVNIGLRLGAPMPKALGDIYMLSCILGVVALGLAWRWPSGVGPTHSK